MTRNKDDISYTHDGGRGINIYFVNIFENKK